MTMTTIDDLEVRGRRVLVRADLNVPLDGSRITDDGKIRACIPTLQRRAIRSTELALAACGRSWLPVRRYWRLNGRHYGALQGRGKDEVIREYGEGQVRLWR